ncbi:MAG: DUF2007 domain-containing protein [Planctomycetota bacterium]|nr:DUF2007 domain-containing protein [Planctomycetota bacterium]
MSSDADESRLLCVLPTEMEATLLVARLEAAGIAARVEGGISAGFRAEAPGGARVLVAARDLARARAVLQPQEAEPAPSPSAPPTERGPIPRQPRVSVWVFVVVALVGVVILQVVLRLFW